MFWNRPSTGRVAVAFVLATVGVSSLLIGASSQGSQVSIRADGPRPLANAVRALEERFGWVITYEDPPFVYAGDLFGRANPRDRIPRGGAYTFTCDQPGAQEAIPERVLMSLLDQFHARDLGSEFRLFHTGPVFHVVPARSKDANGEPLVRRSVLSTKISVKAERRTVTGMLQEIVREVSRSTSIPMIVATIPANRFSQVEVQGGATDERAQDVLVRTLASAGTYSWQLFYGHDLVPPGYALNIHAVQTARR